MLFLLTLKIFSNVCLVWPIYLHQDMKPYSLSFGDFPLKQDSVSTLQRLKAELLSQL